MSSSTTPVERNFSWRTEAQELATLFKDEIEGKVVLVTGVSPNSIGTETVRVLAPYAKTIIAASRSIARVEEALVPILKESPQADIRPVALDLMSGESIRKAAKEVLALNLPIHVVVDNAAVAQYGTLTRTKEGFEAQFGANHLGHFLFNSLILPALRAGSSASTPARLVVVSSGVVTWGAEIRWDDISYTKKPEDYSKYPAYIQSKLANVFYAQEFTRRFKNENMIAYSLHPGAIWTTNMGAAVPKEDLFAMGVIDENGVPVKEGVSKTIPQGTATTIAAAFDPTIIKDAGAYLDDSVPHDDLLPDYAKSEADAARLWELSEQLWGQKFAQ